MFSITDHEIGRGREDDLRRGSSFVCEGRRDLHPRVDHEGLDPHRGQQEEDPPEERHRHGHHQVRGFVLIFLDSVCFNKLYVEIINCNQVS